MYTSLPQPVINLSKRFFCTNGKGKKYTKPVDVIISGGGLVGCALACALGNSRMFENKSILLLESSSTKEYPVHPNKFSNRVCAISPGSKSLFEKIQAWEKICAARIKEVKKMQVWESCSDANIDFQYPDFKNNIAYIIENNVMLNAFNQCLENLKGNVEVRRGLKAEKYKLPSSHTYEKEYVTVKLDNGEELQTKLLVGADGVNSSIRQTMGVSYLHRSYNQKGIVANLKLAEPTENIVAWQRFLPSGPIALLPLTDDMCSLVWTVSNAMCQKLMKMTDEEFTDALNSSLRTESYKSATVNSAVSLFSNALSTITSGENEMKQFPPSILSVESNSRAMFPLALGHAAEYVTPRVVLVGDAAHRVHPLAGQGVNLGFGDVQCLTECLEESLYSGNSMDCMDPLLEYEKQRQRHVLPSIMAIDAFKHLYGTDFFPIVLLRSLGVTLVDSSEWLKERIMEHAST